MSRRIYGNKIAGNRSRIYENKIAGNEIVRKVLKMPCDVFTVLFYARREVLNMNGNQIDKF